jgi:hypothetical protein
VSINDYPSSFPLQLNASVSINSETKSKSGKILAKLDNVLPSYILLSRNFSFSCRHFFTTREYIVTKIAMCKVINAGNARAETQWEPTEFLVACTRCFCLVLVKVSQAPSTGFAKIMHPQITISEKRITLKHALNHVQKIVLSGYDVTHSLYTLKHP